LSLRTRLILTHVFVIFVTLGIVAVSLVFILRDYQRQIQLARLGDAVNPLSFQARTMLASETAPKEIVTRLAQQASGLGTLLVITDKGVILADSSTATPNRNLRLIPLNRPDKPRIFAWGTMVRGGRTLLYVAQNIGPLNGQTVYLGLATPEQPFYAVLDEIGWSLGIAGGITLIISLLVALLLARSIAKPITRLTQATEAIAQGEYSHRVEAKKDGEIGRLAASFNSMVAQVQRSRQMERDFLANVSHELKTPLTSIQGFAQAILDGAVTDMVGARRAAQTIFGETARMTRLIGDLLTIARLESGQLSLISEKIDLSESLPHWVERLQPRAQEKDETLVALVDPLPTITGDPGRLEQVVSNLVDNAIKYSPNGASVTVTAKTETQTPTPRRRAADITAGDWVTIAVKDTGTGIPAEHLPRLFERFYRGDQARVAGGTGLGLAIANEIVMAHGGRITVQSDVGKGSTFTVHLPVKNGHR
jgi:signal transduction histidine kinase